MIDLKNQNVTALNLIFIEKDRIVCDDKDDTDRWCYAKLHILAYTLIVILSFDRL